MSDPRLRAAIAAFDDLNSGDPNRLDVDGEAQPVELVSARRLSAWVEHLEPEASLALSLAARCQHLMRWKMRRADFPAGRLGYLAWRKAAQRFHGDQAEVVLREAGFDDALVAEVRRIVEKHGVKQHRDVQTMEDALCLSFLEHELAEFSERHDDEKVVSILEATWKKMSPRGHAEALALAPRLPERARQLIETALGGAAR